MTHSYVEKRPKPFTINLSLEHAIAQRNYGRLLRLFPGWASVDSLSFAVQQKRIHITVEQRDTYSTVFAISESKGTTQDLAPTQCRIRAYHDVQMIEIIEWNGSRRFKPRYKYPNAKMMAKDEKWQLNRFIGEWLDHCIRFGQSDQSFEFKAQPQTDDSTK